MAPLVTIAIPTYSRLPCLQEAVASALAQTCMNIEVLIGDDGPGQAIEDWARGVCARERRARYQRNPRNLGLAGNWNALATAARGEWLAIIGDDDRLLPDFAQRLLAAAGNADVAFAQHYLIDANGRRLERESLEHTRRYLRDQLPAGELGQAETWAWRNVVPMSASLIRTESVRRLRFQEDLNTPEIEFFIRLAQQGGRFVFVPEYLAEYRVHADSATSAGLWSERLAERLLALPVRAEVEPFKRVFMGPLLVDAVGRCLRHSNPAGARTFLRNEYYPRPRWLRARGLVQFLCAHLPGGLGPAVYRCVYRFKTAFR